MAQRSIGVATEGDRGRAEFSATVDALDIDMRNCTVARTLETLGEKWTFIILHGVFIGVRRFDELADHTGIPRQVLSNRLSRLVESGVLCKELYKEAGTRSRAEYRLTTKGMDVYPILLALRQWGDTYEAGPEGPPLLNAHRDCGAPVMLLLQCNKGHLLSSYRDVVPRLGPGAQLRKRDGS